MRDVTIQELLGSISLETDVAHQLRVHFPELRVRLPIDPAQAEHRDDRFILTMERGATKTTFVQTVKDDHVPGDAYVDLVYEQLFPDARYSLTVDPGEQGAPYTLFEDRPHAELFAG